MPPLKIFMSGWIGCGNLGDETYPWLVKRWLHEIDPEIRLTVNTHDEDLTRASLEVHTVHCFNRQHVSDTIAESNLVIFGGGGLFQDYDPVDTSTLLKYPGDGYLGYAQIPMLANAYNRPLLIWANGVGPLLTEAGRAMTRMAYDCASLISVRDPQSASILQEIGVRSEVAVAPDPVFQLP